MQKKSVHAELIDLANRAGVPSLTVGSQRQAADVIRRLKPDLCVVVGWHWINCGDASSLLLEVVEPDGGARVQAGDVLTSARERLSRGPQGELLA